MSAAPRRVTRSQSKRKIATSSQPTIAEVFAKKRNLAESQTTDILEPPQPAEPVIEVTSSAPVTPAPAPEPELVPDVVVEEEPRPTTTRVAGTKQSDGSKPTKVFPLFNRSKPPATTQPSPEDATPTYPSSQPIDFARSDETFLQALEASKPPPAKSRVKKWKSAPSNNDKSSGLSAEDPIVLDNSPTRTRSLPVKTKLFGSRTTLKPRNKQGFGSLDAPLPTGETQHVRGPQTTFGKGNAEIPFERRSRDPVASTSAGEPSTPSLAGIIAYPHCPLIPSDQCPSPPPPSPPSEIPAEYLNQHPVFRVFSETADPLDANQPTIDLWVDKWAPRMAEHVLCNEGHALYLRDWLKASEINSFSGSIDPSAASTPPSFSQPKKRPPTKRGTKRPRIRREVGSKKAKKRRRRKDDWIADDDEPLPSESSEGESHPLDAYLDDAPSSDAPVFDEFPLEVNVPLIDLPPLAYDRPNAFDMSNTIILCGPSGSGKTAAVYACAAELDWEVFEVYPGVGKRSGAALDNLIGQVGRNHLVTKQGRHLSPAPAPAPEKDNTLTRFLGVSTAQIPVEPGIVDGSSDGTDIPDIGGIEIASDDGFSVHVPPPQGDPPPVVEPVQNVQAQAKQSLILLEEVDILYKDDVNFWPTVVNIIRGCRRPVVLTCNDINLLPLDQLPVQRVLSFTRPPAPITAAYLSAICRAESTQPDESFFSTLRTESAVDLRRCINQCQLGYFGTTHLQETTRGSWKGALEKHAHFPQWVLQPLDDSRHKALFRCLTKHTNAISYLDSRLVLRADTDWSNSTSVDDELGYKILSTSDLTPPEFVHYHHDIEVAEATLSSTSRLFTRTHSLSDGSATTPEISGGSDSETGFALENVQLDSTSSSHRLWMNQLASDLSVIPPFDQRLFLEYESVVREMVVADDYVEACIVASQEAEAAQSWQSGRQTRNSQRLKAGFYRYLDLVPERKDWLVGRAFGGRTVEIAVGQDQPSSA